MAVETETMAGAAQSAAALASARATAPLRNRRGHFLPRTAVLDPDESLESEATEPSENVEPEAEEPPEDSEVEADESPAHDEPVPAQGLARQSGQARVQALLTEALRLGEQYGLIQRHPDGTLLLPGQVKQRSRQSSDCTCSECAPHNQRHWWCVICNSGPHDWMLVKPQYERQTLQPGGIVGSRQAACSAQCARDYLAGLGRQPSGVPETRTIDPTLGLPG